MQETQMENRTTESHEPKKTLAELIKEHRQAYLEACRDENSGSGVNGAEMGRSSNEAWQILMGYVSRRSGKEIYRALVDAEIEEQKRKRDQNYIT